MDKLYDEKKAPQRKMIFQLRPAVTAGKRRTQQSQVACNEDGGK
jgi:hypothetical protein